MTGRVREGNTLAPDHPYEAQVAVRFSDVDAWGHVSNSKYLEYASHVRFQYLTSRGVDLDTDVGAVVLNETVAYHREIRPGSTVAIRLWLGACRRDGSRYQLRQEIHEGDHLSATLTALGAWLSLRERRLVLPSRRGAAAVLSMPRARDFHWLT